MRANQFKETISCVFIAIVFIYRNEAALVEDPFSIESWNWGAAASTWGKSAEAQTATERDRETLDPSYEDPVPIGTETKPEVKPPPRPDFNPVFPGSVIDVDAGGFDFPTGFPELHNIGFGSTFGNHYPGGLFGLGGYFGTGNSFKPWWKGYVCD